MSTERPNTRLFWFLAIWAASVVAALAVVYLLRNLFAGMTS